MPLFEDMLNVLKLTAKHAETQHYLVLFTLLMTSARRAEMLRLAWTDMKLIGEQIGLRARKRKDLIPLAAELVGK